MSTCHPLIIKPAKDDTLSLREGKKKMKSNKRTLAHHQFSGDMLAALWCFKFGKKEKKNILSVLLEKKGFCLQYAETAFEESTTQRGPLLPVSAAPCSGKAQSLCSHLKFVLRSSWPDTKQSFNPGFPFVCYLEFKKTTLTIMAVYVMSS